MTLHQSPEGVPAVPSEDLTGSVYRFFAENHRKTVRPALESLFPLRASNEGVYSTLALGENHYHGGVLTLLGDLAGQDAGLTARIAAIAEYSWTALLILDDLGDREQIRRGRETLWRSKGLLQASQTAWVVAMQVVHELEKMSAKNEVPAHCAGCYAATMAIVGRGQLHRERLDLQAPQRSFVKVMLEITAHLRWWSRLVAGADRRFCGLLRRPLGLLGLAASLKNDLEDMIAPAPKYRPGGSDILSGQITYPLKVFYESLDETARRELIAMMTCGDRRERSVERITRWFAQSPVVERLLADQSALVTMAASGFACACAILPSQRRSSRPVRWLAEWIDSYRELGNPNLEKYRP